ncbi:hypothetical protein DL237_06065 [Pseudooceanicola sediminis]|uniref:C-type lysozyme inhibitor domain-containing protein n=1 Tax=Pseudooceanicola sediminis TaxID=2211117 RepID=A0A399JAP1_9RHOB|nr:MliC family protein [Pseudooceanicola sediminis]RII39706.1 hypothetical protein DL237_06065 [Pseudooceanicola sediminis]|tara:strand:- start:36006 stop:36347 length:342 start_codon:yes stop_codon:yes gene_type:complete
MLRIALMSLMLSGLSGPLLAQENPLIRAIYTCERGVQIPVVYINGDTSVAVLWAEGQLITLERAESGSGARYMTPPNTSGYVWWSKGNTGKLDWFDNDIGEEVTLFAFCETEE